MSKTYILTMPDHAPMPKALLGRCRKTVKSIGTTTQVCNLKQMLTTLCYQMHLTGEPMGVSTLVPFDKPVAGYDGFEITLTTQIRPYKRHGKQRWVA